MTPATVRFSELFTQMSAGLAGEIFAHLQANARPTYGLALQALATQRRLRPVFVERKPRTERYAWLQAALGRAASDPVAANLLQTWLTGAQAPMLCDFLNALGIAHDGKGNIDALPPCPGAEPLHAAVDELLAKYPAETVIVYLHCFLAMDPEAWSLLAELLATDPRLRLPAAGAVAAPTAKA